MNPNDKSVLDSLIHYARIQPSNKVWNFINDAMDVVDSFSYLELEKATTELSKELIDVYKLKEGDRAMLVFFPGLAFTASLLACFKANIIAVPVFPPDPRKLQKDLDHFISIQKSSNAKVALTHKQYNYAKKVTDFTNLFQISKQQTWPTLQWIVVDDILQSGKSKQGIPSSSTGAGTIFDKVAFLQYTSGSTSEPKGVMITHRNLTHNLTLITKELQVDTSTINVAWLPQYHDMGLIGSYLGTLYCGGTGYFMSPISFLKDPNIWLKAISKYRGTHTQAPNFAYALATRKFKELLTELSANEVQSSLLDLSCLKHMINAAEPVDLQAVQEFYRTFRTYGLSDNVVVPTYGLAEHTVFVCSDGKTVLYLDKSALENNKVNILQQSLLSDIDTDISKMSDLSRIQSIVGCGYPEKGEGVNVRIVDPNSLQVLLESMVGEIWVNSLSKADGYWNQPELTLESFSAELNIGDDLSTSSSQKKPKYLRTGDMGFLYNKELFICGRIKDLIIVRGANHHPQDIERTAEQGCEFLRPGCSAAFAMNHETGHTEKVYYVCELKKNVPAVNYPSIVKKIRMIVNKEHGISLATVVLVQTKTIIKTTSGKISRAGCKKSYLNKTLTILYEWSSPVGSEDNDFNENPDATEAIQSGNKTFEESKSNDNVSSNRSIKYSEAEIRRMSEFEIIVLLESLLVNVSSQGPSPLNSPIDPDSSLISLGLDSLTLVQYKGVLEKRLYCTLPDEFLLTNLATLNQLAKAVKIGQLTNDQQLQYDSSGEGLSELRPADTVEPSDKANKNNRNRKMSTIIEQKTPLCPWFTCCY